MSSNTKGVPETETPLRDTGRSLLVDAFVDVHRVRSVVVYVRAVDANVRRAGTVGCRLRDHGRTEGRCLRLTGRNDETGRADRRREDDCNAVVGAAAACHVLAALSPLAHERRDRLRTADDVGLAGVNVGNEAAVGQLRRRRMSACAPSQGNRYDKSENYFHLSLQNENSPDGCSWNNST